MKRIILAPKQGEAAYAKAAKVFSDMYKAVTGKALDIVYEDDGVSELIIIGSDAVNDFLVKPMINGEIDNLNIRYGTDDYCIRSINKDGRNMLILAGGRGRSTLYAVYDYFERVGDCHYFWDGDVIPSKDSLAIDGLDINESPHFTYRGLRYFAHRGLKRFQAEHWGFSDWKQEIDWMVKKRLNFFMLRIGMDDLWQRVFPDDVAYPDPNEVHPEKPGYSDRSVFWPLEYRGMLRKKILNYAFECDLTHPEDCGTMTHWYSPTPKDYLEKHNPKLMLQEDRRYYAPQTQIWDITKQENMDNYMKLTDGYVREFNPNAQIFHTIGLAEREMLPDRDSNMRLKLFAYRKIAQDLRQRFPNSKLLLASWDFVGWWKGEDVQKLLTELDPDRTMILDYTSDIDDSEQSFINWGVMGKFPWIFGLFHAYEAESSLRGPYERYDERLKLAAGDPMCKGMILWPELSHSDPLVLEYLTQNAWTPLEMTIEELTGRFCTRRYGEFAAHLNDIWQTSLPVIKSCDWGGYSTRKDDEPDAEKYISDWDVHKEMWFDYRTFNGYKTNRTIRHFEYKVGEFCDKVDLCAEILKKLSQVTSEEWSNPFVLRDMIDIARTVVGRYMNVLIMKAKILEVRKEYTGIQKIKDVFMELIVYLSDILAYNTKDFSLYRSLEMLSDVCPVNRNFEITLKKNLADPYDRQYCYEPLVYLYTKECNLAFDQLMCEEKPNYSEQYKAILDSFMATPLSDMKPQHSINIAETLTKASECIKRSTGILN